MFGATGKPKLWAALTLMGMLAAVLSCSSSPLQKLSHGDNRSALSEDAEGEAAESPIQLSLEVEPETAPLLGLLSSLEEATYLVKECRSGFQFQGKIPQQTQFMLYRYDQNCHVEIQSFRLGQQVYNLMPGRSFDFRMGAYNPFVNTAGQVLILIVQQQLPARLDPKVPAAARFSLAESKEGKDLKINYYELVLRTDKTQVIEGSNEVATVTVQRQKPAKGRLIVPLIYSGQATPGQDTNPLPKSLILEDGEEKSSFQVKALPDSINESNGEILKIAIGPSPFFFTKGIPVEILLAERGRATLALSVSTLDFGTRALNLPHSLSLRIENLGQGPATRLRLAGIKAPFRLPGGFPGDHGTCGPILMPKSSCLLQISFTGTRELSLIQDTQVLFFDGEQEQSLPLKLKGALRPAADVRSLKGDILDWGERTDLAASRRSLILKNFGQREAQDVNMSWSSKVFRFAGGSFPGEGGNCRRSLAAGQRCVLVLETKLPQEGSFVSAATIDFANGWQAQSNKLELRAQRSSVRILPKVYPIPGHKAFSASLELEGSSLASLTFEILVAPKHGRLTLKGAAWTYEPEASYQGHDGFWVRALDSTGPSAAAHIQILVAPRALILSQSCFEDDQTEIIEALLKAQGYSVQTTAHSRSFAALAPFVDLIVLNDSLDHEIYRPLLRSLKAPILSTNLRAAEELGLIDDTQSSAQLPQELGFESQSWLPGQAIAAGRRMHVSLPKHFHAQDAQEVSRLQKGLLWLIQNPEFLLESALSLTSNQGQSLAKREFPLQLGGLIELSFTLALESKQAHPDARLDIQLGRCDRMDRSQLSMEEGGLSLIWGGKRQGLRSTDSLGWLEGKELETFGPLMGTQKVSVWIDMRTQTFTVSALGHRSDPERFDGSLGLDCLRVSAQHFEAESFSQAQITELKLRRLY